MHDAEPAILTDRLAGGQGKIKAHYDRELKNHDWTFVKEIPVKIWSQDYGAKEAIYCKGIYDVTLRYSGLEPGIEYTFGFTLSCGTR